MGRAGNRPPRGECAEAGGFSRRRPTSDQPAITVIPSACRYPMLKLLRILTLKVLSRVRRSSPIFRAIFGVRVRRGRRILWDFTTLALKNCLRRRVVPGHDVLEIGTGPYAVLSLFLAKRVDCNIVACDINEAYVENARACAALNGATIEILHSDLFEGIEGEFDVIFFNSIYIPRQLGKELRIDLSHETESDWCGGETGAETIDRFLRDAPPHLKKNGEVLLGFNTKYLREDMVTALCEGRGYAVRARHKTFPNPGEVLVVGRQE